MRAEGGLKVRAKVQPEQQICAVNQNIMQLKWAGAC